MKFNILMGKVNYKKLNVKKYLIVFVKIKLKIKKKVLYYLFIYLYILNKIINSTF